MSDVVREDLKITPNVLYGERRNMVGLATVKEEVKQLGFWR